MHRLILLTALVAMALTACLSQDTFEIRYSSSPNRSNPVDLSGQTLTGVQNFIHTANGNASSVTFYVDDVEIGTDTAAPFDLAGSGGDGSWAYGYNVGSLADGQHSVRAVADTGETATATFFTGVAPEPTATATTVPTSTPSPTATPVARCSGITDLAEQTRCINEWVIELNERAEQSVPGWDIATQDLELLLQDQADRGMALLGHISIALDNIVIQRAAMASLLDQYRSYLPETVVEYREPTEAEIRLYACVTMFTIENLTRSTYVGEVGANNLIKDNCPELMEMQ